MRASLIEGALTAVTKKFTVMRKKEERARHRLWNRSDYMYSSRVTVAEVAREIMEQAYMWASADNTCPANVRQIYYAARPLILAQCTKASFTSKYFTQNLLKEYMEDHDCSDWDVVWDNRGHFTEPHTQVEIGCGTIAVREYLKRADEYNADPKLVRKIKTEFPTYGHEHRYGAVLFIEKEGFTPLLQQARIAEKYDIAILSTKGMSVGAARRLVDELCGRHELPLLIARDFDAAGFSIAHTLVSDSRTYVFEHKIPNVIDLGLRLKDVQERGLGSEPCKCTHRPSTLETRGATPEEIDFLIGGQRVELNALPSDQFIEWLETKIEAAGIKKVVPTTEMLGLAYRRAATIHYINEQIEAITDEAHEHADALKIPPHLKRKMTAMLKKAPTVAWDRAVAELVIDDDDDD